MSASTSSQYARAAAEARAAAVKEITPGAVRIIRLPHVESLIALRKTAIYEMMKAGDFPRPVVLGPRARGWIEGEVLSWIAARASART